MKSVITVLFLVKNIYRGVAYTTYIERKKANEYDMAQKKIQQLQRELDDMKKLNFIAKNPNIPPETIRPQDPKDDIPVWWRKHMK